MKYELNVKMDNGKVSSKCSCNMEIFGFKIKVKEYEIEGDLNDAVKMFTEILRTSDTTAGLNVIGGVIKALGIKQVLVDDLLRAATE